MYEHRFLQSGLGGSMDFAGKDIHICLPDKLESTKQYNPHSWRTKFAHPQFGNHANWVLVCHHYLTDVVFGSYLAVVTTVCLKHFMEKSGLPIQE